MKTLDITSSKDRVKKFRANMLKNGFKYVHKWVLDIENITIQEKTRNDLANYNPTQDEKEWNQFAIEQLENLEGWK